MSSRKIGRIRRVRCRQGSSRPCAFEVGRWRARCRSEPKLGFRRKRLLSAVLPFRSVLCPLGRCIAADADLVGPAVAGLNASIAVGRRGSGGGLRGSSSAIGHDCPGHRAGVTCAASFAAPDTSVRCGTRKRDPTCARSAVHAVAIASTTPAPGTSSWNRMSHQRMPEHGKPRTGHWTWLPAARPTRSRSDPPNRRQYRPRSRCRTPHRNRSRPDRCEARSG